MDIARLFDCPLCTGIPEREREQFIEGFDYSVKSYMKGEVVFRQGDVCRFLYILLEGEVEAEMTDDSGAMLRIEAIRAPRAACPSVPFCRGQSFPGDGYRFGEGRRVYCHERIRVPSDGAL